MALPSYLLKGIVIGDSGVGKSCLVIQFTDSRFKNQHDLTIGVEYASKNVSINGKPVKMQLWDTAGQESFKSITRSYYRGASVALLVYDITNRESFENLGRWVNEVKGYANNDAAGILVANKVDLEEQRQVSREEGENFAEVNNLDFIEVSAREGTNVEEAFMGPARYIIQKVERGEYKLMNEGVSVKAGPLRSASSDSCKC